MMRIASLMARAHRKLAYEPRIRTLVELIAPRIESSDRLLDVGCGNGVLAASLAQRVPGLHTEGIETHPRGGEPIAVRAYDGKKFPFPDDHFDVVTIADVLHHDPDPEQMLRECSRVARRLVIVKDHLRTGRLSQARIATLDWLANAPHDVPCLYKYWTIEEWHAMFERSRLAVDGEITDMNLYHWSLNAPFSSGLHLLVFTRPVN